MITSLHLVALSAALLLLPSGVAKIKTPGPSSAMLRGLRVAALRPLTGRTPMRLLGAAELAVGAAFVVAGGRIAAVALAVLYAAFVVVVAVALGRGARTSCGCFGSTDAPIGRAHLGVDVVALAAAGVSITRPAGALGGLTGLSGVHAVIGGGQVVVLAMLAYLCITALPSLAAARRALVKET
jgi:hypothetical protein